MKISRYIIIFFLILSCCAINHELRIMWILENHVSEYQKIYSEEDTISPETLKQIINIAAEHNIKLLLTYINGSNLITKEVVYKGNEEVIDDIRNHLGLHKLKLKSYIFSNVNVKLELWNNPNDIPDHYTLSLSGNKDNIDNVLEQIKISTGISYAVSEKISQNILLIIPWIISLIIIIFFNIFVFSISKKEILLNIVFGYSPFELFISNTLKDITIYSAEFFTVFFIILCTTGLCPQIDFLIVMFLLMCTASIMSNLRYLGIYRRNSRKILGNYLNTIPLITQSYIIRFIITTLSITIISYTAAAARPFINYYKAKNVISQYQDYTFSKITYNHNENQNIIAILQTENSAVEDIYRTYFDQCDILTLTHYDKIVYSNVNAYSYIRSRFDELESSDLQKDLYFLIPDNLSEIQKSKVLETIRNDVVNIEGHDFDYTYDVIEYKSGKDIMVFNYSDTGCGFNFEHDPYLVYNTIDFSTLDTDYTSTDRIPVAYSSIYHMSNDVIDAIKKAYPQIDINQTNIMELYNKYSFQAKATMLLQLIASLFLLMLLSLIINVLVKATYEVNAKEYALKKVFGHSFFNRFKNLLGCTVLSDLISAVVSRKSIDIFYFNRFDSSISASFFPYHILWSVSALVIIANFSILISKIFKHEKENITKVLKGGAL